MPEKRKRGRPPKPMPEQIDDDPRRVAWSILNTPPKEPSEWQYLQEVPSVDYEAGDKDAEESGES